MNAFDRSEVCVRAAQIARETATDPKVTTDAIAARIMSSGLDVEALAWGYAEQVAQVAHREAVRSREHEATRRTPRTAPASPIRTREEWQEEYDSRPDVIAAREEVDRRYEEGQQRIMDMVQDSVTRRASEMFANWTADLLGSSFALPDGTRVTWAEATSSQHRARIEMLNKQAAGTIETAALHEKALREMGQAGVQRLADLMMEEA